MRLLHTSDWHVGKTLRGRRRLEEQEQVLREVVDLAAVHEVDAVLVCGDLYDSATPSAEAQRLVVDTLLKLARNGTQVIAMAGNHDHPGVLDAYRPWARAAGLTLLGEIRQPEQGAWSASPPGVGSGPT